MINFSRNERKQLIKMARKKMHQHEETMRKLLGERYTPLSRRERRRWIQQVVNGLKSNTGG